MSQFVISSVQIVSFVLEYGNEVLESIDSIDVDWWIVFFRKLAKIFNFLGGGLVLYKFSPRSNLWELDRISFQIIPNILVFFDFDDRLFVLFLDWFSNLD